MKKLENQRKKSDAKITGEENSIIKIPLGKNL